jgi:hypothetical protein
MFDDPFRQRSRRRSGETVALTKPGLTGLAAPAARRGAAAFSGLQVIALLALLLLLASMPVWTHPLPPLSDYVNHLARMYVIATGGRDANLARYYEIDWQIIPNLMMDLIVPLLGRAMSIYLAGQIYMVATFALIMSGALALNRALFGRWSVLPLAAFPLVYNYVFLVGVMNYVFGIGLALWALAVWVALRERPWPWRYLASTLFVIGLFFCHLFALGVYGLGLLSYELLRLFLQREQPLWPRLAAFVAAGLPFIPALPLLLASPTLQLAGENYWEPRGKIDGLIYVIEIYSDFVAIALTAIAVVATVWAVRHRLMRVHPLCWVLLTVSGLVYLLMPRVLFATYMADQRLPIAVAFMLVACADIDLRHRLVRRGFVAMVLIMVALRVIEVDVAWSNLSMSTNEFRASVKRIKPGSRVLVAYADQGAGEDVSDLGLVHAACIAMIERAALVTTAFTVPGKQIMHVRPAFRDIVDSEDGTPPSIAQLVLAGDRPVSERAAYWDTWQHSYDYLYVLFTETDAPNPDPARLALLHDGTRFQLYRIKKPE